MVRSKDKSDADEKGNDAAGLAWAIVDFRARLLGKDPRIPAKEFNNFNLQSLGFSQETITKLDSFLSASLKSHQISSELTADSASKKQLEFKKNIEQVFKKHFATLAKGVPGERGNEQCETLNQEMKALQPRLAEITGRPAPRGGKPVQHEK
ncbi:hypothetical protein PCANC_09708 [Puccinia coronata f. sp. avenae]|jgi:hypothetical protein|uniref:Uncharacterized protein n=1 Tax=Puccinia coronata f. sp. avenae TaxID=200324 RepID=A0A2N5V7G7_9BASI|nr:hypothetical protein PCANC_09708 [Puccinia coronata f. sp. avenae]